MEKFHIGAKSLERAEEIAKERGLSENQWRRAHGGSPPTLREGVRVSDRRYLIGDFTERERRILTAHLLPEDSNG